MSHFSVSANFWVACFPRVSGDEPALDEALAADDAFSPRERG